LYLRWCCDEFVLVSFSDAMLCHAAQLHLSVGTPAIGSIFVAREGDLAFPPST
jgi:hypothetical protein